MEKLPLTLLVAVGSRRDQACSIGSFARAETEAMKQAFREVDFVEPDAQGNYPSFSGHTKPDVVFYHSPALVDRGRPFRAFINALRIRAKYPKAIFIPIVHEFTEAPLHWKVRQIAIAKLSSGVIANTLSDFEGIARHTHAAYRSRLGPTLERQDLKRTPDPSVISKAIEEARTKSAAAFKLDASKKWILHPGLVTHGKGADALDRVASALKPDEILILMGGLGPKPEDREFARSICDKLEAKLGSRFSFIQDPSDEKFSAMLTGADLVILAYDVGVSERRSSFLSAASCGADIWTTTGEYSMAMELEKSGAVSIAASVWAQGSPGALASLGATLDDRAGSIARRAKNLTWSRAYDWSRRAEDVARFIQERARKAK